MLTEYFGGHGATGFFEAQAQMLSGLQGLIETIGQHGSTIGSVLEGAMQTDQTINSLFDPHRGGVSARQARMPHFVCQNGYRNHGGAARVMC